ncbi:pyridoxamine 5'-phosphate oxidase family protein [Bradyrhizobium sacchari]|uniref:pyridoxamine 5'-phosphate oxidase family protein n=1 Tax=Bradyrhizobium sacchari TaxID=1399419 RepID=UPI001FD89C64|nr:pyridoxamine 5'-phosphate oxidase family protein [Bradyrhizobium sacchari]
MITVPDFSGNLYYNTLGNFSAHPYAALLFIDFLTGDLVHIRGRVEILGATRVPTSLARIYRGWILRAERLHSIWPRSRVLAVYYHDRALAK